MKYLRALLLTFAIVLSTSTLTKASHEQFCMATNTLLNSLKDGAAKEVPVFRGVTTDGTEMIITGGPSGSFSMLLLPAQEGGDLACTIIEGEGAEVTPFPLVGKDS